MIYRLIKFLIYNNSIATTLAKLMFDCQRAEHRCTCTSMYRAVPFERRIQIVFFFQREQNNFWHTRKKKIRIRRFRWNYRHDVSEKVTPQNTAERKLQKEKKNTNLRRKTLMENKKKEGENLTHKFLCFFFSSSELHVGALIDHGRDLLCEWVR